MTAGRLWTALGAIFAIVYGSDMVRAWDASRPRQMAMPVSSPLAPKTVYMISDMVEPIHSASFGGRPNIIAQQSDMEACARIGAKMHGVHLTRAIYCGYLVGGTADVTNSKD